MKKNEWSNYVTQSLIFAGVLTIPILSGYCWGKRDTTANGISILAVSQNHSSTDEIGQELVLRPFLQALGAVSTDFYLLAAMDSNTRSSILAYHLILRLLWWNCTCMTCDNLDRATSRNRPNTGKSNILLDWGTFRTADYVH
jgi:hypothetical protein